MLVPLFLLTFNLNGRNQTEAGFGEALRAALPDAPPSLLVFSFQELTSAYNQLYPLQTEAALDKVEEVVVLVVGRVYGDGVKRVAKTTTGGVGLIVMSVGSGLEIGLVETAHSLTGVWGSLLKGGAAVRVECTANGTTTPFYFVALHLTANQGAMYLMRRDEDWKFVLRTLRFASGAVLEPGSHLFCLGDLNYRAVADPFLSRVGESADTSFFHPRIDELSLSLTNTKLVFKQLKFAEAPVTFAPTYKFKIGITEEGRQVYKKDASHNPLWCDRVVFCGNYKREDRSQLQLTRYAKIEGITDSDHQPVYLVCSVPAGGIEPLDTSVLVPLWFDKVMTHWTHMADLILLYLMFFVCDPLGRAFLLGVAAVCGWTVYTKWDTILDA